MTELFTWGESITRTDVGGIPFKLYEPRRRRVPELLHEAARWGSRNYLIQGDRELSFDAFRAATATIAGYLRSRGVGPGDRVLILAANSPEWVISLWAGLALGAIVAPGNGWWSEEEVAHAIALTEPRLVIGDAKRLVKVPAQTTTIDVEEIRALVDSAAGVTREPGAEDPLDAFLKTSTAGDENDPALIVFTAGTTGLPKGATLAHRSWIATMHQTLAVSHRLPQDLSLDKPGFVSLLTGPLFHIGGMHALGLAMVSGGTLVFLEGRFDPGQVLEVIERRRVEVWGAIPTMTIRVLEHPSLPERNLDSMRSVPLGGAPVSPELLERIQAAFPNTKRRVTNVYGLTECSGTVAAASGRVIAEFPGTTGEPLPCVDLKIAAPDPDGVGELLCRTPGQMLGYWNEPPDPTVIDADGFVHTGDLGKLVDGRLYITGRSKDIVIRGGENIAAPHVEAILHEHPDVADVAVVGLPHPDLGEEVAAAVRLRPGAQATVELLGDYARRRMAAFEVPSAWWLTDEELPMTDAGKADKKRLRKIFPAVSPRAGSPAATDPDPVDWVHERWVRQGLPDADRFAAAASLMRAHHLLTTGLEESLRPHGLTTTTYLMLVTLALSERGTRRLSYLARYLMVHQTTVTQMVDQCEKRGLIERRPHPTDRRTTLAVLTRDGRTLVRRASKDAAAAGFGLGGIDAATVEQLSAALHAVRHTRGDDA